MPTDTGPLKRASQNFRLRFEVGTPRSWQLVDVDTDGEDAGTPTPDPIAVQPLVEAFDGVTGFGTIAGSLDAHGFSCDVEIERYLAAFVDFYQTDIWATTWHADVRGTPGAAGVDPDEIRLFRGYMRSVVSSRPEYAQHTSRFSVRSTSSFLADSGLSRGIDARPGSASHPVPTTSNTLMAHLVESHTNLTTGVAGTTRSQFGIYLPDHEITDGFTINDGKMLSQLQQLADNFALEGFVACRREDDLFIAGHPSLTPDLYPNLSSPVIDLDDSLLLSIEVPEGLQRDVASVTVVATRSNQVEYTKRVDYANWGDHKKYTIRTDDTGLVDTLATRAAPHLNRRFRDVKVTTGLLLAIDLGDVVTLSTRIEQRNLTWSAKPFLVKSVSWQPNTQTGEFEGSYVLDEILL